MPKSAMAKSAAAMAASTIAMDVFTVNVDVDCAVCREGRAIQKGMDKTSKATLRPTKRMRVLCESARIFDMTLLFFGLVLIFCGKVPAKGFFRS